ncbi:hypothetical protein [Plastoroseomonas hellenica]|nr:hypothetical protein [Plastoroseomonas hellenica]MBR0643858.1 hypothetical protein [Plastoroseomonas hellenica]
MAVIGRRGVIGLALAATACGGRDRGDLRPVETGPPSYRHLTPLRLDVANIDIQPPAPGASVTVAPPAPVIPAEALLTMAQDRLSAAGRDGTARFLVLVATLTRSGGSGGGMFSSATERLDCVLRCRVEVVGSDGQPRGFAEAEVRRSATQPADGGTERARNADALVRAAMADMNVEFEFQLRRNLRGLLMDTDGTAPVAPPVEQEALPQG